MADTLALDHLYNSVTAAYTAESDNTPHYFGWEEVTRQQRPRSRIIWVPGDPQGNLGDIGPPRGPSDPYGRPLATLHELFHVYIHGAGVGTAQNKNERLDYRAVRTLYDTWFRHVYTVAHGWFKIVRQQFNPDARPREFRHGATILVVGAIQALIPDLQESNAAPLDTTIDLTLEDVTEQIVTPLVP